MTYAIKKSMLMKILGISLTILLPACSSNPHHKRELNGNEDYLKSPALHALISPIDILLPLQNGDYAIPPSPDTGEIGKKLDIRPPQQPLALLEGSQAQYSSNRAILQLENNTKRHAALWSQIVMALKHKNFPIASCQDTQKKLSTNWIFWTNDDDKDKQYSGRYQINLSTHGHQISLQIKCLELQEHDYPVTNPALIQHYTIEMLNSIENGLPSFDHNKDQRITQEGIRDLHLNSRTDENGFPILVASIPYNTIWNHLPMSLTCIGMKIRTSSRLLGVLSLTYKAPDHSTWKNLGINDPSLRNGEYTLQVGDLGSHSTLQFINSKGRALTKAQNHTLLTILQKTLKQT
ncbi:outer membrane protein assembly factor BamC [Candidatus Steffania adelgidicola]|uniref:outer membrane protein assembly factor BamC n=1 Tax=Candidatus Steffania adelgidicola TaxID=1076626 RepID=UPI001D00F4F5|nr:outer membrane protein assembly factor BamC [Candidatus Steffania adelgidicola]UDG80049.1 Outer membrane protein assembly factor BamC [Candidatus Steffania adelgidicola]